MQFHQEKKLGLGLAMLAGPNASQHFPFKIVKLRAIRNVERERMEISWLHSRMQVCPILSDHRDSGGGRVPGTFGHRLQARHLRVARAFRRQPRRLGGRSR